MNYWDIKFNMTRPWIHMMRGLGVLDKIGFDSADSCNVAINHCRTKKKFINHVREMADRIAAKVKGVELAEMPLFQVV